MKLQKAAVGGILALLVIAGGGSVLYTALKLKQHPEYLKDYNPSVDKVEKAKGETITLTESKEGQRKWVLKMTQIRYSKDNNQANLIDVKGLLYGENEEVLFIFESPTGLFYKQDSHFVLSDGVKMFCPKAKVKIGAPNMEWSAKNKTVVATGGVEMVKDDFGLTRANKAVFAMDFSKIQFSGHAVSQIGNTPKAGVGNQAPSVY